MRILNLIPRTIRVLIGKACISYLTHWEGHDEKMVEL